MQEVAVTKIDAARIQLDRACKLFYVERDIACAHALAAAANELLEGTAARMSPRPMSWGAFLDLAPNRAGAKEAWKKYKYPANFLKHFDRDPDDTLSLSADVVEHELFNASFLLWEVDRTQVTPAIALARSMGMIRYVDPKDMPPEYGRSLQGIDPNPDPELLGEVIRRLEQQASQGRGAFRAPK